MVNIQLNVSGKLFTTTLATLQSQPSLLKTLTAKPQKELFAGDPSEEIFLDRDHRMFDYVLNFLRDGFRAELPDDQHHLKLLHKEADFYSLQGLVDAVEAKLYPKPPSAKGQNVMFRPAAIPRHRCCFAQYVQHGCGGVLPASLHNLHPDADPNTAEFTVKDHTPDCPCVTARHVETMMAEVTGKVDHVTPEPIFDDEVALAKVKWEPFKSYVCHHTFIPIDDLVRIEDDAKEDAYV